MSDNPLVALNRAVAVAMVQGPEAGLEALAAIEAHGALGAQRYRIEAVRGHVLEMSGDRAAAARAYAAAATSTASAAERQYLQGKSARVLSPGAPPPSA